MEDLSLHVLDLAENGVRAGGHRIEILVAVDPGRDRLVVDIRDDGKGMTAEEIREAHDPFYTTKTERRVGLGLPLFGQAASEAGGGMTVESEVGVGTRVRGVFQLKHIDRKPLGDLARSLTVLLAGNPGVDVLFTCRGPGGETSFDSADLREADEQTPWDIRLLQALEETIREEIRGIIGNQE